jgi:hypothetical protein
VYKIAEYFHRYPLPQELWIAENESICISARHAHTHTHTHTHTEEKVKPVYGVRLYEHRYLSPTLKMNKEVRKRTCRNITFSTLDSHTANDFLSFKT